MSALTVFVALPDPTSLAHLTSLPAGVGPLQQPGWLERLGSIDPTPLFVASLLPYLAFLWWASRVRAFPRLALRGFQLTLLFVAVTIAAAVVAQLRYGELLANVDPLHGGAEAFLTLSNLLVAIGFLPRRDPE